MISIIVAVMLVAFIWLIKVRDDKLSAELRLLNEQDVQDEQASEKALQEQEASDSFYQKLLDGFTVNILIIGDSIGAGTGTQTSGYEWFTQLSEYLKTVNGSNVSVTNISMGGNSSYAGYVRTMSLSDDMEYDLAIICYGQNDGIDDFSKNYESIIRAVRNRYPDCSIISILESSQREYTEKMKEIETICEHYNIPVADTIAAFNDSGKSYDDLTDDGVHPNDAGQYIYFSTVKDIIDDNVEVSTGKLEDVSVINPDVREFDNFVWYDVNSDFERVDDTTYTANIRASGILGIDYTYKSGDNKADIYVDEKLFKSPTVSFDYDFSQRHILVVSEDCTVENEIKIVFGSKEQADGFQGMCFSWK